METLFWENTGDPLGHQRRSHGASEMIFWDNRRSFCDHRSDLLEYDPFTAAGVEYHTYHIIHDTF